MREGKVRHPKRAPWTEGTLADAEAEALGYEALSPAQHRALDERLARLERQIAEVRATVDRVLQVRELLSRKGGPTP